MLVLKHNQGYTHTLSLSLMEEDKEDLGGSNFEQKWKPCQGGFRASMFVFALSAFENMGFVANMSSMVLYFMFVMYFNSSAAANTLTNFLGTSFLLSLIGGFISDTYITRLNTCLIFGAVEVVGLMMITYQAHTSKLHPDPCGKSHCIQGGAAISLYTSLGLYALGGGGVRGALPSLGADQFDSLDPKENKSLASYFNWLLFSLTLGASLGVTVIVKIGMDSGWDIAFFMCMLASLVGFIIVAIGKPFYRVRTPRDSPILIIIQVLVVAFQNRKLTLPEETDQLYEISDKEASSDYEKLQITHQFRSLEKAAIVSKDGVGRAAWRVCTVTQVEEVKILTRMLPIIGSTIIMNTCLAQLQTFSVQQGSTMNLHLGSLVVPAPSIPVIPLVFMAFLVPIYEFVFIPLARKMTGHQSGITQLQRVGVGLVLSAVSMSIAGVIEVKRRRQDIKDHTKNISLFWLSFQYGIFGIADMFTLVGLLDFFYKEAPSGMKSLSTSFTFLSLSIGYFLSTIFVSVINSVTARLTQNKQGWLAGQTLNDNRLDLFYWFLSILSCINFGNYLFWASWYKYKPPLLHHSNFHDHEPINSSSPMQHSDQKPTDDEPSSLKTDDHTIKPQQLCM